MGNIQRLVYLFNEVQLIGVEHDDSVIVKKHIATTNIFLSAYGLVILLYLPFLGYYIQETKWVVFLLIITFFIFCFCLFLSYKRRFVLAKSLGIFVGITLLVAIYLLLGIETNISFYCLAALPFPFMMFNKREFHLLILLVLYDALSYLMMQLNPFHLKPIFNTSDQFMYQYGFINTVFSILSALVISMVNFSKISFYETALIESKKTALEQKNTVEKSQKEIENSINYSKSIQSAIIPNKKDLNSCFKDNFMIFSPKDIVSGDMPWLYKREGFTYVAAIDCTGHGVPGAMLSLIGNLLLNDIVKNSQKLMSPSEILDELHLSLVNTLKQHSHENGVSDGMDIALCRISPDYSELVFSGAYRPLYVVNGGLVNQYKGDRFPIGGTEYRTRKLFKNHLISLKKGDSVYMFSDGYHDQFGGENNKKIGTKRLRELLEVQGGKKMSEVNKILLNYFNTWKGSEQQIDDVLMIGLKF